MLGSKHKKHLRGSTQYNTPLGRHTDRSPMGLGQYNSASLGEYCDPHTASSVFLILVYQEVFIRGLSKESNILNVIHLICVLLQIPRYFWLAFGYLVEVHHLTLISDIHTEVGEGKSLPGIKYI